MRWRHLVPTILWPAITIGSWSGPGLAAEALNFVIIQPGQPGTSGEAQPVMDALAGYLQRKLGPEIAVTGVYFNEAAPALDFLDRGTPAWGIVSLGFYARHAGHLHMMPLASTRPGGFARDVWRLAVGKEAGGDWRTLRGRVSGTMLFETEAAACLLFGTPAGRLPFPLEGTFNPLRSLRALTRGEGAGVVLDRLQHAAMQALPLAAEVKIIQATGELPTAPVVWFGPPGERMRSLAAVLQAMSSDPEAAQLLQLLQTDGFGPPDEDLPRLKLSSDARCAP